MALIQMGFPGSQCPWITQPSVQARAYGISQPLGQSNITYESRPKPKDRIQMVQKLLGSMGLLGVGMLLHRLPVRQPGDGLKTILPVDWKVWARILLGIDAVHRINQAFDWHLPPWLGALESIAIINPVAMGFSRNTLKQTAVMAPLVASVVQGASLIQARLANPLQEQWQIPPMMSQMTLTAILGLGTMIVYPKLYKRIAATGIIGKELKQKATEEATTFATTFTTCARGCSPSSFICLSELADISGSFINWTQSKTQPKGQSNTHNQPQPKNVWVSQS